MMYGKGWQDLTFQCGKYRYSRKVPNLAPFGGQKLIVQQGTGSVPGTVIGYQQNYK